MKTILIFGVVVLVLITMFFCVLLLEKKHYKKVSPPIIEQVFVWGVVLFVFLYFATALGLGYSGMHALGGSLLVIVFPIIMGILAWTNRQNRKISTYFQLIFWLELLYFLLFLGLILFSLLGNLWFNIFAA